MVEFWAYLKLEPTVIFLGIGCARKRGMRRIKNDKKFGLMGNIRSHG